MATATARSVAWSIAGATGHRAPWATADILARKAPLRVHFDATGSTDPDTGEALQWTWDFGGDNPPPA